jgi:hypothetical protein
MKIRARTWWMIGGGLGLAVVVAAGVVLFAFQDLATSIDEDEVGLTVVTGGGAPGDFGLYRYTTSGYESTDALAGSRHDYPATTYLTIQPGGCGQLVRWRGLEQRYEEWDYCPDGTMKGFTSFHEWFRVANTDVWECPQPAAVQGEPGATWEGECHRVPGEETSAATKVLSYEVLGLETVTVGDEAVETLHVRVHGLESGGTRGSSLSDIWFLPETNLPVRWVEGRDGVSDSRIGEVGYSEHFEATLVSLRPGT